VAFSRLRCLSAWRWTQQGNLPFLRPAAICAPNRFSRA
jgi:hypothetical protein